MDYQTVIQNPMEEFDDLNDVHENGEDEEAEEDGKDEEEDVEKGVNMRPSLLFTPSLIHRRSAVYNLHQVR